MREYGVTHSKTILICHSRAGGNPCCFKKNWIPACAGMTWKKIRVYHGNDERSAEGSQPTAL